MTNSFEVSRSELGIVTHYKKWQPGQVLLVSGKSSTNFLQGESAQKKEWITKKIRTNSLSSPRKFTWNWRWFADLRLVENVEGKVFDIRSNFVFQPACTHLINPSLAVFLPQLWLDNQIINRNKNYNCRNLLLSTVSGLSNFLSTISPWTSVPRVNVVWSENKA